MTSQQIAFLQNLGIQELVLIFLIVLLLFGAKRLPEIFRSFGKSIKEFKKATSDIEDNIRTAVEAEEPEIKQQKYDSTANETQKDTTSSTNPNQANQ